VELKEDNKESGMQEILEPMRTQSRILSRLVKLLEKSAKSRLANGKSQLMQHLVWDKAITGPGKDGRMKESELEEKVTTLENRVLKQANQLETTKASLKKAEEESKEKSKTLEDLETKVSKLSRRLQTSPTVPYALTLKRHFLQSTTPHDCMCIVCGEKMRNHVSSPSCESPEVNPPANPA